MRCNLILKIDEVCYKYEKCPNACDCKNVPQGIREKLKKQQKMQKTSEESC